MSYKEIIIRNPDILMGKPVIKGTRISVELIVRKFAGGYTIADILKSYPHLAENQVLAALEYAADVIANEEILEFS